MLSNGRWERVLPIRVWYDDGVFRPALDSEIRDLGTYLLDCLHNRGRAKYHPDWQDEHHKI